MEVTTPGGYNLGWKEGAPTLSSLQSFLAEITDPTSTSYIPEADRIAVFDVDGTIVSETDPHYLVAMLWLHAVLEDHSWTPSALNLKFAQGFKASLTDDTPFVCDDYASLLQVQEERFMGMTPRQYNEYVDGWLSSQPSRFFEPMVEIIRMLKQQRFTIYLVSASDRDFMQCLCAQPLGILPRHIIGSDVEWTTEGERLVRGRFLQECDGLDKVIAIRREIRQQPVLAFGNSSGDYPMFRYTTEDNPYPSAVFCLLPDGPGCLHGKEEKIEKTRDICQQEGWQMISMSEEWEALTEVLSGFCVRVPAGASPR